METKPTSEIHLPPGFRFHPSDEELIIHYLKNKIASSPLPATIIADLDLYKYNPWDLPKKASFGDDEWYFFTPRDRKYPNGARPNRAAASGYWKATGTDKPILTSCGTSIGVKKSLVFYKGRPPKGIKTDWIMHEYRVLETMASRSPKRKGSMRLDDWVLCGVRQKNSFPKSTWEDRNINPSYEGYLPKVNNNPNSEIVKNYLYNDCPMLPYIFASQNATICLQSSDKSYTTNDKNFQFTVTSFDNLLNPLKRKQKSCILPSKKITEADSDEKDDDVAISISNNGIDMMNFYGITNHSQGSNFNLVQWNSYMQCQELDDHLAFTGISE